MRLVDVHRVRRRQGLQFFSLLLATVTTTTTRKKTEPQALPTTSSAQRGQFTRRPPAPATRRPCATSRMHACMAVHLLPHEVGSTIVVRGCVAVAKGGVVVLQMRRRPRVRMRTLGQRHAPPTRPLRTLPVAAWSRRRRQRVRARLRMSGSSDVHHMHAGLLQHRHRRPATENEVRPRSSTRQTPAARRLRKHQLRRAAAKEAARQTSTPHGGGGSACARLPVSFPCCCVRDGARLLATSGCLPRPLVGVLLPRRVVAKRLFPATSDAAPQNLVRKRV